MGFALKILYFINVPRVFIGYILVSVANITSDVYGDLKKLGYRFPIADQKFFPGLVICLSRDKIFQSIVYSRLLSKNKLLGYAFSLLFINRRKDIEIWSDLGEIGSGLTIYHGYGTIINVKSCGRNLQVYQGVTIGKNGHGADDLPTIGNNVIVYSNAVVVGKIHIGDNVIIGANTVVTSDIPDNCIVYPAKTYIRYLENKKGGGRDRWRKLVLLFQYIMWKNISIVA